MINKSSLYDTAIEKFDERNSKDPNKISVDGKGIAKELLYAQRTTEMLANYWPEADETVWLAARSHHIARWEKPRSLYPMDRSGYMRWRKELAYHHAKLADFILDEVGYDEVTRAKVSRLITKRGIKKEQDVQILEDVICLVFMKYYLEDFVAKHDPEKSIGILRKTMSKMSEKGRNEADKYLGDEFKALL